MQSAPQFLESCAHFVLFCFGLVLSTVALSVGDPARKSRGSASDTCNGVAAAAERRRLAARGELKFKCDPRRGRELAAAREGPRAQEASAFKGPALPGRARRGQHFTPGSAPKLVLVRRTRLSLGNSEAALDEQGGQGLCVPPLALLPQYY